ncbi:MAG: hypothetical protein WC951_06860 [Bacteroidales bacterium]
MKKNYLIILLLVLTASTFAQSGKEDNLNLKNNDIHSHFKNRKEKGFYSAMQVSFLFGSAQQVDRGSYYYPGYELYPSLIAPPPPPYTRNVLAIAPSLALTSGYMLNKHWAAGAGVGFEVFDHNLFPLFAELRYTLWDDKISPFVAIKGGYSFGSFKARQYDQLYLNWLPYNIYDAKLRHYGGFMVHPEIGVKVPLSENSDLLFTAAYRFQKTRSVARREYDNGQFDEWEHKEDINRLSFGLAIIFR